MKIIGIYSSANAKGNSATILREALIGAKLAKAEVDEIALSKSNIGFCKACMYCVRKGKCLQDDDFEDICKKILDADGIIFSSPTFSCAPNIVMKNFIERLKLFKYIASSTLGGKYIIGLSTAKSFGANKTAKYLASIGIGSIYIKSHITGTLGVLLRDGKTINDMPNYLKKARALGTKMVKDYNKKVLIH